MSYLDDSYDFLFKLILIGDSGVGKSCLMNRYTRNEFDFETKPTIGVEFASKFVKIGDKNIKVTIWDTAGQERFRAATNAYYRNALGAFIVYDLTNRTSFLNVKKWMVELRAHVNNELVITLVGNKSDLRHIRAVCTDEAQKFARENNMNFIETSALDSVNITNAFKDLIIDIHKIISTSQKDILITSIINQKSINIKMSTDSKKKTNCCLIN